MVLYGLNENLRSYKSLKKGANFKSRLNAYLWRYGTKDGKGYELEEVG